MASPKDPKHGAKREHAAKKKAMLVRFTPEMLERIDRAAKRLGLSRSAFVASSTAEKLERMEA